MRLRRAKSGFTFAELLVLVAVGGVLTTLLVPTLSETRSKLLQQACVANMKQWGMAFYLYSQDYSGSLFYDVGGLSWADSGSPYKRYLGNGNATATMRSMRICPARAATMTQEEINFYGFYNYDMPIGTYKKGFAYANANAPGSPFYVDATTPYLPSLRWVPKPSDYLLLIEGRGNTIVCGNTSLHNAVTQLHSGGGGDPLPAINRHANSINCLFGDYHVESLPLSKIDQMDGNCSAGNPHFILKN